MKRLISLLLTACMFCTMVVFAETDTAIPEELIPSVPVNYTSSLLQDFDENYNADLWAKNWGSDFEIVTDSGSNVMKIPAATAVELKYTVPNVSVVQANVKMDYVSGAWTHILDIGYDYSANENTAYAVFMVKDSTYPSGRIIMQNTGKNSSSLTSTWITYQLPEGNKYFEGDWFKLKAEYAGNIVNIYIDDVLCISFKNLGALRGKYLGFTSSSSTVYLDNILIAADATPSAVIGAIPSSLVPVLPENHKVIAQVDFTDNYDAANWKNVWSANERGVEAVGENNVYYIGKATEVSYTGFTLPSSYTVQANIFLNYTAGSWPRILDMAYTSYNSRYNLQLANDDAHPYGKIVYNGVGKTDNTAQYYYLTREERDEFFDKWIKLTAVVNGSDINIYFNDTLVVSYDQFESADGIGFNGSVNKVYVDNILISEENVQRIVPQVEKDPNRSTILYQDFENLTDGSIEEINSMGYTEIYKTDGTAGMEGSLTDGFNGTGKAFNFVGSYLIPDLKLKTNTTIEMNIKLDYTVTDGKYTSSYPELKFNRYYSGAEYANRFYFNVDGTTKVPSFVVVKDGNSVWTTRTASTGSFDAYADAGEWCYLKLEKTSNCLKFYWNDKENPAYVFTYTGDSLSGGGFAINSSKAAMMAIDNIYISSSDAVAYPLSVSAEATSVFNSVENISDVNADVNIINDTDVLISDATVIMTAYDSDNRLVDVEIMPAGEIAANPKNGTAYAPVTKSLSLCVPGNGADYIYKVFVWNTQTYTPKIKPLAVTVSAK